MSHSTERVIAANRFGFGARPTELAQIGNSVARCEAGEFSPTGRVSRPRHCSRGVIYDRPPICVRCSRPCCAIIFKFRSTISIVKCFRRRNRCRSLPISWQDRRCGF